MQASRIAQGASRLPLTSKRGNKDFYKGKHAEKYCIRVFDNFCSQVPDRRSFPEEAIVLDRQESMSLEERPNTE
jgi:hypothetical protein